ncbi:MAG: ribosome biogenesis GTP-binding protein YihA/YsxC [Bacteroidia bacterium]|nr:ribosome biogenesis GTP-binding protein YihA/YsxC [Bacteroidia bacterium]MDW8157625.1 ribosome biogenesis GTP-binding protein YihA/YsxC [Bacteroidia bacterium]
MLIKAVEFIKSSASLEQLPAPRLPEYAFVGRSNVGKSSLINMLCQKKDLAKTSSMPGKTRLINHFLVNGSWYLVDLPGYGYAKVDKKQRALLSKIISSYLFKRTNLMNVFVLIDSRLEPQPIDLEFCYNLGVAKVPFSLVFTKIDKLSRQQLENNINAFQKAFLKTFEELPPVFKTSAIEKKGREEILNYIEHINQSIKIDKLT